MALTHNHRENSAGASSDEVKALLTGVTRASRLVFAGLLVLALSILATALTSSGGAEILSDRRMHYALIAGIVLFYVYLQRN